jgi:hypothetical protein
VAAPLDLTIVREHLVGATLSGSFDPDGCDFVGAPGCEIDDIFVLERILKGAPTRYATKCPAFGAP